MQEKIMTSLKKWLKEKMLVSTVAVALVVPSFSGAADIPLVDIKQVESSIVDAQTKIVSGNLDEGLGDLATVKGHVVTTDLAARMAFVSKLAEVRMAEKMGDQDKVLAALNDAFRIARQADQIQAVWQIGLSAARAEIAAKDRSTPVLDFLAKGPASAMQQFSAALELARLRMAAGNVSAAEAELRTAAGRAETLSDWNAWIGVVNQLASAVDAGQAARAGADVYSRLHECATPVQAAMSIAQGRYLLSRNLPDSAEAMVEQAVSEAISEAELLSALSLRYDLAVNYHRAGKTEKAQQAVAKADELALSCPPSVTQATIRGNALMALGQPAAAAAVFETAAKAVQTTQEQQQMLSSFGTAMVAAGDSVNVAAKLKAAEATPVVFVNTASAMVRAGDSLGALRLLSTVPLENFANDAQAVTNVKSLMEQIQNQKQEITRLQGDRVRAIAASLNAAAKDAQNPQAAKTLTDQAAAMTTLADQVAK